MSFNDYSRSYVHFRKFPNFVKRLEKLENKRMKKINKYFRKKTIKKSTLNGVGLHTGANVTITFKPSKINSGYILKRVDLADSPIIEADVQYVVDTQRGTNLEKNGVKFKLVNMFFQL